MYLIKNEKRCKELMEKAKDNSENFNTSLVEQIISNPFDEFKTFDEKTNEIKYNIEQNIKPVDILNYESRIFIYSEPSRNNINDIFINFERPREMKHL